MVTKKALVGASILGAFMVGGTAVATITDREFRTVDPVNLTDIEVAASVAETDNSISNSPITVEPGEIGKQSSPSNINSSNDRIVQQSKASGVVPGLTERKGTLQLFGDDFYLDGRELDFGPDRWMIATQATGDLNGNGTRESWWHEVSAIVGRTVTVLGDVDDDDIDVFQINSFSVRPLDRPAPWSDDWEKDDRDDSKLLVSTNVNANQARRIALGQVPGSVIALSLDSDDGVVYWEVEIQSNDGALYDIEIDANTGDVIEVDRD